MGKDLKGKELGTGLSQRKDGRYQYRCPSEKTKYFSSVSDAKKHKRDYEYEKEHNVLKKNADITLNVWFDYWIEHVKRGKVKENTVSTYSRIYKWYIKDFLGGIYLKDITPAMCQMLLDDMDKSGKAEKTASLARTTLKAAFTDAIDYGYNIINPINRKVKCNRKKTKDRIVLSEEEQRELFCYTKRTAIHNMFVIGFETGMRIGELLALRREDVDLRHGFLNVSKTLVEVNGKVYFDTPKTKNAIRKIPISATARTAIVEQLSKPDKFETGLLFCTRNGTAYRETNIQSAIRKVIVNVNKAREASGNLVPFPAFHAHSMRHTFATRCAERNVSIKALQLILGHAKVQTTLEYYVHVNDETLKIAMDTFERKVIALPPTQNVVQLSNYM